MRNVLESLSKAWREPPMRKKVLGIGILCAIGGLIAWVWPTRVEEVARFDGGGVWRRESAPPRRLIVWEPAERLPLPEASDAKSSSVAPAFTDGGATLYFSRRTEDGQAEIMRSHFRHGQWERPLPVAELNSPADDMRPILSRDGSELYFYSNRPGGRGGYDLYVSNWDKNQWSVPQNLGPQINTPANEFDPCLDPSETTLYFSSNRTPQMIQRAETAEAPPKDWTGSLRAEMGLATYDLYRAARSDEETSWASVESVAELNTPEASEGAPAISPDGAFLYFASDRPARPEEPPNLDLYRVRLLGGEITGLPENLGTGINTPAHETEPSLSPEGFRLAFASNRDGDDDLYVSTATEVYETSTRDTSRLKALINPWLWAGLVCAGLLLWASRLMYSHRGKVVETIWPARFFAASLALNVCFVLLLFLWKLPGVVDAIVSQFQEPIPASRVIDEETLEAQEAQETLYSKVGDLPPVESAPIDWPDEDIPAAATPVMEAMPRLPEDSRLPLSQAVPAHIPQTIVAVRPSLRRSDPRLEPLTRIQPQNAALSLSEPSVELPMVNPKPLEAVASLVSKEKLQAVTIDSRIPSPQSFLERPPLLPRSMPLSSPLAPPDIPTSKVPESLDVARRSPEQPEPAPIAKIDEVALKPVPKPEEEQILPAEPGPVEQRQPVVRTTLKIPQDVPPSTSQPVLKSLPVDAQWSQSTPEWRSVPKPPARIERNSPTAPIELAKVAELDVLPALKPAVPPMEENTSAEPVLPMVPQQSDIPGISKPPVPMLPKRESPALAKNLTTRDVPRRPVPELSRTSLEPSMPLLEAAEPVEVHEQAELTSMLLLRNPETRRQMAQVLGHHPAEEAAVKRGLLWLASHQNEDGSWSLHEFHKHCEKHGGGKCTGAGQERSATAATGLALLPFLAAGYVPESKEYGPVVAKGLEWLTKNQHEDGKLQGPGDNQVMYSHGIATIALCEAYGMTRDAKLGESAKKAVEFIVKAQHKSTGGWRYNPGEPGDTSVVGWQVMALKSAEMAGIDVPEPTYEKTRRWLASVEGQKPIGGVFGYTNRSPSPAMTAEGLLCLEFLAEPRTSPRLQAGADDLIQHLPRKDQRHTSYYWYYATQVLYHLQDDRWTTWNEPLRKLLLDSQDKSGPTNGTWVPKDRWEQRGGRIYATAIKLLMLEIDYRHLPLYGGLQPILPR